MLPLELMQAQRKLGLTCEELAETLGYAARTIRQWREGKNPVRQCAADRITELLAMPEAEREQHVFRKRVKWRRAG
jgi:DNA-binding transcriptional regulator YiaG